eukprot:1487320-Alexandrium_andersonii.AAC.2
MPKATTARQRLASQAAQLFWWLLLVRGARVRSPCMVAGSGLPTEDQTIGHKAFGPVRRTVLFVQLLLVNAFEGCRPVVQVLGSSACGCLGMGGAWRST